MQKQIKTASLCHLVNDVIGSMEPPLPPSIKKHEKNEIKLMVYEYKFMVYEYPFADKFGCCSLYDSIERARWRPRQTQNK